MLKNYICLSLALAVFVLSFFIMDTYKNANDFLLPLALGMLLSTFLTCAGFNKRDFDERKYKKIIKDLTDEEKYLFESIMAARSIQQYLWGEYNEKWGLEEWKRMFKKRMVKIDDIDASNPHALIELKKRVLQNTALGIALLKIIDDPFSFKNDNCKIPSNLPQYN